MCAVRIWLDRKVTIPRASNACSGFDEGVGWTFFDLSALHDEFAGSATTVLEADFYHAARLLPLPDDQIVSKVRGHTTSSCAHATIILIICTWATGLGPSCSHDRQSGRSSRASRTGATPAA